MQEPMENEISILLYVEGGYWIAQCLQFDVTEQGKTLDEALDNWTTVFLAELGTSDSGQIHQHLSKMGKAPGEFWVMWNHAKPIDRRALNAPDALPNWMIPKVANEAELRAHH